MRAAGAPGRAEQVAGGSRCILLAGAILRSGGREKPTAAGGQAVNERGARGMLRRLAAGRGGQRPSPHHTAPAGCGAFPMEGTTMRTLQSDILQRQDAARAEMRALNDAAGRTGYAAALLTPDRREKAMWLLNPFSFD